MTQLSRILQLFATFLPIYGVIATVVSALVLKKRKRVWALVTVPLATIFLCSVFDAHIARDGNMLYVLLTMLYLVGMLIYYHVLIVLAADWFIRKKRTFIANETQP